MSNIYITEPNTEGKVLLHTSFGDLDVELWPQQAPKACRNFVQLCLEGYYDQTIFHRIIASFMVQGGDPTGTGQGGESIYGGAFIDEFHSRLKFNHRGLLAMANENKPNTNHSQFFFTLNACDFLDKKHTIFGKVTGNTIFNLLSVGDLETDAQDRPTNPPKLLSAEVLWNPFKDIVPRAVKRKETQTEEDAQKKKKRERKATKDLKLLSFGDEEVAFQEDIGDGAKKSKKKKAKTMISSHDLLDDRKLKAEVDAEVLQKVNETSGDAASEQKKERSRANLKAAVAAASASSKNVPSADASTDQSDDLDKQSNLPKAERFDAGSSSKKKDREEYAKLREELRKSKKAVPLLMGEDAKKLEKDRAFQDMLTPLQQQRQKYLQRKKATNRTAREQDTLSKLKKFQATLSDVNTKKSTPLEDGKTEKDADKAKKDSESYHGQVLEDNDDDDDTNDDKSWMTAKLKFKKHIDDQFRAGNEPSTDDYMTIDSRNEKTQRSRRDSNLTPFGIQDAKSKGPPSIKAEMERAVDFSALVDEEDVLWTTNHRESAEEIQTRAKEFLTELFRTIPESHVAVVTHFGFIEAVCAATLGMKVKAESVAMMIDAVRVSALEDNEKCRFLFEMFDIEHRGVLTKEGVRAFIEATFAAYGIEFVGAFDYDAVVDKVFDQCRQQDKMSYNEFKTIFADVVVEADDDKTKDALGLMSTVVETQRQMEIVYNNEQGGRWYRIKKFCRKYKPEIFWLALYFLLMIGVFIAKASRFPFDPAVGNCPRIAKGFAEICLVNTMFVLLPMCRNFVTGLRTLPVVVNHLPIDNHIEFHKICGVVMLIASLGHTAAWLAIVIYVRTVPLAEWKASRYHHLSFVRDENLLEFALRVPIWTGVVMLICAAIAAPLCLAKFRRGNFNLFWVTHMLFIPFLILMAFHGFARWVAAPQAPYWILPPIVIFLIEKRYRMTQVFGGQTKIIHVQLSKESVAIFMKKPKSFGKRQRFLPGMYVFINVPTISKFEWHPFTISALHNDPFLTVDDVFHEFGKKFYGNSLLTKLDNLMAKLEYKFWLLKKRTPEKAKTKLGLHHVPNYIDHPNYDKWLGYLRAYNKKHKIDG
ncbi:hypothetical protein JG688_00004666 [Phytophthora aleatoria]|uniref:PPIase cyclophilin-type domain-containing protein n=1 Tax=Phytophthora aleatoria TaxID=2496075 RepID=A0A8J5J1P8_9STRA|nr:hypothetical protein JG688_00004666 [Phytophthora aleatoria]